ncbi:MAG: adenylosuccinate synthase [Flavobacteriales bacterium]|jgi:adenylosuccinate synthase|nr:adenylosuccinate synthase [Flavobacteriales bacterium]MDA9255684.1 adenylosuccinate synthase [Schleiferiaceae bacterium]NCF57449.1 adenylosuccinate synthase [Bacteroidota bacterium]MBT3571945.1 adenylosuccinate synthase [Flavobacteriales bacterium]MBT3677302.1 adenylosuccinate synthase [Flavobacteriales bacterium]
MTKADILLGLQWGDEGKGKIVDVLTKSYDVIARFQGGPNAGHTLEFDGIKHVLHTIPSGIFHQGAMNVVGNGVVIDPIIFCKEMDQLLAINDSCGDRLWISRKAHLILPTHRLLDAASEAAKGKMKIGSTLKGIGPTYMDKTGRNGLRVGDAELPDYMERYQALKNKHLKLLAGYDFEPPFDLDENETLWLAAVERLIGMQIADSDVMIQEAIKTGKRILAEGAQGTLLDIDFGTYPFVTSSTTTAAGACTGLGLAPNRIGEVYGIFKAYCTRVGSGPFPTELNNETGQFLRDKGHEYGSTTGRPRRCGWLDMPALKYAVDINGVTQLMMMKADVMSGMDEISICTSYKYQGKQVTHLPYGLDADLVEPNYLTMPGWSEDLTSESKHSNLPLALKDYIAFIEAETGVPVVLVSVGPDREQTLWKEATS